MSRTILQIRKQGFFTKTGGICWRVLFNADGSYYKTDRVQDGFPFYSPNCSQSRLNQFATALGAFAPPSYKNGWTIIRGVGMCPDHPGQMLLKDRMYAKQYWKAYQINNIWHIEPLASTEESYCGAEPDLILPEDLPTPSTGGNFLSTSINNTSVRILATVAILAFALITIWKR